ncbi:MAG: alpha/beta fold hydrolase [Phycisphaerae bacterium]|nr:alpha/beta fold hydrolase [Phycisphaerae bacterium]
MQTHSIILDGIWSRPWRWEPLRATLEQRIGPAEIFRYDCSGVYTFETSAQRLIDRIRQIDGPVNLIGFSMGGLVVRTACLMEPNLPVRRAAFLNTPHSGSVLAWLLPLAGVKQMRPGSPLLRQLERQNWTIPTLVIWNPLDTAVVPPRSTRWNIATATTTTCGVPMHIWPIYSRKLREQVTTFLAA